MPIPVPTRLWWSAHVDHGAADHRGVHVELDRPPRIPGLPSTLTEIEFGMGYAEYRDGTDRRRDMSKEQHDRVLAALEQMAALARKAFGIKE